KATLAFSLQPELGGADIIRAGNGNAVIFGGAAGDDIANGAGNSTLFGDGGHAEFDDGVVTVDYSVATAVGGADTIVAGSGKNLVFGGAAGDFLSVGTGNSVLFGDNGFAEFVDGALRTAYAIDPDIGGADTITTGDSDHVSIGGADGDTITT